MAYKVAVASIDSKHVNQSFLQAPRFLVFRGQGSRFSYVGSRDNPAHRAAPEDEGHRIDETTRILADCQAILVSQIGPEAASRLNQRRIRTFTAVGPIGNAIQRLAASGKIQ